VLVGCGIGAVLGGLGYLGFVLATSGGIVGPVLAGRPVAWLVVQALAVAAVLGGAATGWRWWRRRATVPGAARVRLGLALGAGVLFVPWAVYWGLLVP
jgi:hypothetical protein